MIELIFNSLLPDIRTDKLCYVSYWQLKLTLGPALRRIHRENTHWSFLKWVVSCFYIKDNVKIILLYDYFIIFICKTTLLPLRTTFNYANNTLDSRNFSKEKEILFAKHMQITEIYVVSLFYMCHFCIVIKLFNTKIVKNKRLRLIYCDF